MKRIAILGGTNQDVFAYAHQPIKVQDSNPGYLKISHGGVGRNIAENLARLKLNPILTTAIGNDDIGKNIIKEGTKVGILFDPIWIKSTPSYFAVIDKDKDMFVAVAAMDEVENIDINQIKNRLKDFNSADIIILDTNYSIEVLSLIFEHALVPIYVEAISTQKALKIKPFYDKIQLLKLNLVEAETLSGIKAEAEINIKKIGHYFYEQGVKETVITLGHKGAYYFDGLNHQFMTGKKIEIKNTTGAGDAFFAGVVYAKVKNLDLLSCGVAASIITLKDEHAVSPLMNPANLEKTIKEYQL